MVDDSLTGSLRPADEMARLLGGFRVTQLLFTAAALGVADALARGPKDVEALAREVGAHPGALHRMLRALASHGVFLETSPGWFASTPLADVLRDDVPGSLRPMALSYGQPWWWDSFGRLLDAVRTGEAAFDRLHGEPFFAFLERRPDAAAVFDANMAAMTEGEAEAIVAAYPFGQVDAVTDVGGGGGALVGALLARWPHLRVSLLDRAAALEGARARGLTAPRCVLVEGDFTRFVPPGADVYLLKDVLHDWNDEQAVAILRRCRTAMTGAARLLVVERLMPTGNAPAAVTHVDITMLVLTGGRERTLEEYASLLEQADLDLLRAIDTRADQSILEARISAT
ncbi:MAG: methyltransferase [Vicinamibacterales bacterium]